MMAWETKKYARINWKNRPSTATALGATNLNRMDVFLNEVDNALIDFEARKLNIATANSMIASLQINTSTGIITATELNGRTYTWDLNLEKIPVSFSLSSNGVLTMTTSDGTKFTANISELIKEYVFDDSDTIDFNRTFSGNVYHVTAIVRAGSLNESHFNPNFAAEIRDNKNIAQSAANDSLQYSKDSKRWAVGDNDYPGSETDNSKYYAEQAQKSKEAAEKSEENASKSSDMAHQYAILAEQNGNAAVDKINEAISLNVPTFQMDILTGHLLYQGGRFAFTVPQNTGHLMWEVAV